MAYVDRDRSRETALSGIAAIVLVGGIGCALVTGLAMRVSHVPDMPLLLHDWTAPSPPPPPESKIEPRHTRARTGEPRMPVEQIVPPVSRDATIVLPKAGAMLDGANADPVVPPPLPAVDRSSRVSPRSAPGSWVTSDDYPAAALRSGQQGDTGFRLDVGADGRATACTVTAASGSDALDQTACRLLLRRARFAPAHDAAGAPTVATYTGRIAWRVPAD